MVLSSGSWPFQQSASFTLPTEVSAVLAVEQRCQYWLQRIIVHP